MIHIELPSLIAKLNPYCRDALEEAAALCMARENPEVTLTHLLMVLLDRPHLDAVLLLAKSGIDSEELKAQIGKAMPTEKGLGSYPAFSPLLVALLQDAWLLGSAELSQPQLRSGSVLLAALISAERYLPAVLIQALASVNRETLRRQFASFTAMSLETVQVEASHAMGGEAAGTGNSAIEKYCTNFTELARQKKLDPVLCRDDEISLMIDILSRRRKNNPIVVGDAGVGKSAVVEGLAMRIVEGKVPTTLQGIELVALDIGLLQAGASVKGEFEKRVKAILNEIKTSPEPIILFIDEAHTLIGAGNAEGGGDAANLLKPALARGELCTVAATTWKEYKKFFEKDPALSRRFQLVKLDEPTTAQAVDILRGLHSVYEQAHGVIISDEAVRAAAELSARYLSGRQLPDKAIDVLDTACARIAINLSAPPRQLAELDTNRQQRQQEMTLLKRQRLLGQDVDEARVQLLLDQDETELVAYQELHGRWMDQKALVEQVVALRAEILAFPQVDSEEADAKIEEEPLSEPDLQQDAETLESKDIDAEVADDQIDGKSATDGDLPSLQAQLDHAYRAFLAIPPKSRLLHPEVDAQQVAEVIADWTGVPVSKMDTEELSRITDMPTWLAGVIKGQDTAIACIHRHLLTARADLRRHGRPQGAFLLVGPSGVGKTETVVQLAEQLYGGQQFLTTINMSEYQEKHTVSRLIGSPPGYVGFGEGGILTESIRKMPYSVVLLDEVEKAHPDVLNLFYQAFDKGELVDGEGRRIDCQNVLFFLTSNLGYQTIVDLADVPEELEDRLYPELAAFFKPALLARMQVVPYLPLPREVLAQIVQYKLDSLVRRLEQRYGADVDIALEVRDEILARATRSENGARMLEAIIDGQVLPSLSLALLNKLAHHEPVTQIRVSVVEGQFVGEAG